MSDTGNRTRSSSEEARAHIIEALKSPVVISAIVEAVRLAITPDFNRLLETNAKTLDALKNELDKTRTKYEELKLKCDTVLNETRVLRRDDLLQARRLNNLRFLGVQEEAGEDTTAVLLKLAREKLGVQLQRTDVEFCQRMGNPEGKRTILVSLKERRLKSELYAAKRRLKGSSVVVKEDLAPERLKLYRAAVERYGIRAVWSSDCIVHARVDDVTVVIASVTDIV